jgi:hypothetical protein
MLKWLMGEPAGDGGPKDQSPALLRIEFGSDEAAASQTGRDRAHRPWQSVEVLVPASIAMLREDVPAYQQFCTAGHVLIICGDSDATLAAEDLETLTEMCSAFDVVLPVPLNAGDLGGSSAWKICAVQSHPGRLPDLFLPAADAAGRPLSDVADPLRTAVLSARRARNLDIAVDALAQRHERECKRLANCRLSLGEAPKQGPRHAVGGDKEFSIARDRFVEGLALLEKQIGQQCDRATQPLGKFSNLMRELVSQLNIADLDEEASADNYRLSVHARHLALMNRRVEHALRQELTDNVATIDRQLKQLTAGVNHELGDLLDRHMLVPPRLQENQLWATVENLLAIGKEAHIELARKGFFDVLTAGRQKVFIIIMFVSLLGRVGLGDLFSSRLANTGFGIFMITVLISSMINALFVWRREKRVQSEKELAKIKDTLFNDGCKVIDQVMKGKLLFFREYFKEAAKVFEQQTKRAAEEYSIRQRSELEAKTRRSDAIRQSLETQVKTVTGLSKQVARLRVDAHQLSRAAVDALQNAIRGLHAPFQAGAAPPTKSSEEIAPQPLSTRETESGDSRSERESAPRVRPTPTSVAEGRRSERNPRPMSRTTSLLAERRASRAAAGPSTP